MPYRLRRRAIGGVVAAGLLGLREALSHRRERDQVAVVAEAVPQPSAPDVDVVLDPEFPELTIAVVRGAGRPIEQSRRCRMGPQRPRA